MAYQSYYQNSAPALGTQQYQFRSPPRPTFQPQPSWGGSEYFRAHSGVADNTFFNNVWGKVRNFVRGGGGVGKKEARSCHRNVYSGHGDIRQMLPADLGAAAAYEIWRSWKKHYGTYGQPLGHDRERQREALAGLAVGEVEKLWSSTGRMNDINGRTEASEVAAATASRIFDESWSIDDHESPHLGRARTNSMSMQSLSPAFDYSGNYNSPSAVGGYDGGYDGGLSPSPYGLHRSRSFNGQIAGSYPVSAPIPIASRASSAGYSYAGQPGYIQSPSPTSANYMMTQQQPVQHGSYGSYYGSYPGTAHAASQPNTIIVHTPSHHRSRSHSRSHHSHSRSHSHSHHSRHRSSSQTPHVRIGSHGSGAYLTSTSAYNY